MTKRGTWRCPLLAITLDPALRMLFDVTGSPIDTDKLGPDLRDAAAKAGVANVGFDPLRIVGSIHTAAYNHTIGTQKSAKTTVANPSPKVRR